MVVEVDVDNDDEGGSGVAGADPFLWLDSLNNCDRRSMEVVKYCKPFHLSLRDANIV